MEEVLLQAQSRIKKKRMNLIGEKKTKQSRSNYISNLFTRTLLSIILVLVCAIYINLSDKNLIKFNNNVFKETIAFNEINNLYTKYFGNIMPKSQTPVIPVFNSGPNYSNISEFNENTYQLDLTSNTFSYLESGIVVFIGEKENLGNTIIVQGIDGVDIWYSNLESINVTLYDYVEKEKIIGEFKENKALVSFMEDGQYINYEKYLS